MPVAAATLAVFVLLGSSLQEPDPPETANEAMAEELVAVAAVAWQSRFDGASEFAAAPEPVAEALAALHQAIEIDPQNLDLRLELLRALYFQGEEVLEDPELKLTHFDAVLLQLDSTSALLAASLGLEELPRQPTAPERELLLSSEHAGPLYFWSALLWGAWGNVTPKMKALRQGVADKIRDYGDLAIELQPEYEEGGPLRVVGRLHHEAPKVPMITGWIDRDRALDLLGRAWDIAPQNLTNQRFWAEALWEHGGQRQRAVELLEQLVAKEARPDHLIEDRRTLRDALLSLERYRKKLK